MSLSARIVALDGVASPVRPLALALAGLISIAESTLTSVDALDVAQPIARDERALVMLSTVAARSVAHVALASEVDSGGANAYVARDAAPSAVSSSAGVANVAREARSITVSA